MGGYIFVLGFVAAAIAIVVNNILWIQFTRAYQERIDANMPFLLLDWRRRWQAALAVPTRDERVEELRRQLRWSQVSLPATFALVVLGLLLMVWR